MDVFVGQVARNLLREPSSLAGDNMDKLCSLKDIDPGSIVEVPAQFRSKEGELAVVMGLEYEDKRSNKIFPHLMRAWNDKFVSLDLEPTQDETKFNVVDNATFQRQAKRGFTTRKIALPNLDMSVGCDPEVFVKHADGTVFPAWEFLPSEIEAQKIAKQWLSQKWLSYYKKEEEQKTLGWEAPSNVLHCPRAVPAYWDGVQAEFTPWAKNCIENLHNSTRLGLEAVLKAARQMDPSAKLTLANVVEIPPHILKGATNEHIQFRCSSSYNVYNDPGVAVADPREYKWRAAGGHIHLGFDTLFTAPGIEQIVRGLDAVLGVAGVSLAAGIDNPERRRTYGRAGEFRLPTHGIEYRVLSNFWLCHPAIAHLVFDFARAAARFAESGLYRVCWDAGEDEVREVINTCDVDGARKILRRNAAVLMGILHGLWIHPAEEKRIQMRNAALRTLLNGVGTVVPNPSDIEGNWELGKEWADLCRNKGASWKSLVVKEKPSVDQASANGNMSAVQGDGAGVQPTAQPAH